MKPIISESFEETRTLGKEFASSLKRGTVIALHGDLGSGKTTFVQGLAKGLGIEKNIISPTFIIMRTYDVGVKHGESGIKHFYHVDLYRIENEKDVEGIGLLELLDDPENIIVIEWPEKIEKALPKNKIDIFFEYLEDDKRKIVFGNKL